MMAVSRSTISGEQCSCRATASGEVAMLWSDWTPTLSTQAWMLKYTSQLLTLTLSTPISPSRYARMMTGTSALICGTSIAKIRDHSVNSMRDRPYL